ncbi:hypothetical protein [uncultured Campylobacter sp.]|uniref:hypothetical protein n=1 Tax=uncultured Campylobacter sp. TaxID=218934 RepID=UPI00260765DA|nr:hypothetical protein [uncultured Campylobacter sp.]
MQIPNLIQNFIRKRIVSESILLPFFYPEEGEFESFQEGYRLASRKTGEELADNAPGQWRKSWRVIARNGMDDPFFVDFALGDASPVYFAYHGAGSWEPIKVADKVKTLVFLKKFFENESFAATKERAQNLPLCVFSGIEELALSLQDKLASLGVKFYAREISFSEFIARSG